MTGLESLLAALRRFLRRKPRKASAAPADAYVVEPTRKVTLGPSQPRRPFVQVLRVRGSKTKITADERDGWLHVTVDTDDSVVGYAVTVNGKDLS